MRSLALNIFDTPRLVVGKNVFTNRLKILNYKSNLSWLNLLLNYIKQDARKSFKMNSQDTNHK